jgi:hypothetical protein
MSDRNSTMRSFAGRSVVTVTTSEMGGTGLEPVTPSSSIWCSRSRQFGGVRSTSIGERNAPRDRTPERTRTHDDPCHSCHAAQPSGLVLTRNTRSIQVSRYPDVGPQKGVTSIVPRKEHESHGPGSSQDSITTLMGSARCAIRAVRVRGDNRHRPVLPRSALTKV